MDNIVWNKCQTPLEKLSVTVDRDTPDERTYMFKDCPQEVRSSFGIS
jgi:hypothetical protein